MRFLTCLPALLGVALVVLLLSGFTPVNASEQPWVALTTLPASGLVSTHHVPLAAACPNQGGIIDSVSVPVSQPLELAVVSSSPAPKGGATFELSSEDPSIVAAGDPRQSFLPQVTIPEGQTQSNPFFVFGIKVGATMLDAKALTPGFSGFSVPLGAWDVNPGSDPNATKFLDANPPTKTCRAAGSPTMSTDPNVLSTCGLPVQGAATDGVTQLLMRMVSGLGGTACYNIVSTGPPDQGKIPPSMAVLSTQSVGGSNYAFSFYQVPDGYDDTSASRPVMVQFTFTPNIGNGNTSKFTAPLMLVRPPLLMVHGLWSDRKAFPSYWMRKPGSSYFSFAADYGPTHDASFSTNAPRVQGFVASALAQARNSGYAATQADVVAHSMGGILTRLYAGSKQFMRPDNFNKGDIHRFVTLDTPHGGSSFANLLVTLHSQAPADLENTVTGLTHGSVVNGAVCDLAENSAGLQPLAGPTNLKSQVVTGTGGPTGTFWNGVGPLHLGSFEAALTATRCTRRVLIGRSLVCVATQPIFDKTIVDSFRFTRPNDAIIAICSQQGGVGGTRCPDSAPGAYNFGNLIHFGADVFFFQLVAGVTNSQAVANQAFQLLDGPDSTLSTSIPGLPADGSGAAVTVAGMGARAAFTSQCLAGTPPPMKRNVVPAVAAGEEPMNTASAATGDTRVKITRPINGQVFAPGASVSVTVSIAAPLTANDIGLLVPLLGRLPGSNYDGSTYQVTFTIPNTVAGPFQLTPVITDTSNKAITGVAITIAVRPTTAPLSLTLSQSHYMLTSVGATERVDVIGNYSGGIQRDLTSSASGTTYKSNNTAVIAVDTEGNVKATGLGTAVVTVTNSGIQAFATFTVEDPAHPLPPSNSSAQLTITRSGFRVDRNTGFFDQLLQLSTARAAPVIGPLYLVLNGLPTGVTAVSAGTTRNILPVGSPYFMVSLPDGATLPPGTILKRTLQFLNPARTRIAYTAEVFRTSATP